MTQRGDQLIQARLQKLDSLRELGINPYPTSYEKTHTNSEAKELFDYIVNKKYRDKKENHKIKKIQNK